MAGVDAACAKGRGHHLAGDALAEREHVIGAARGALADGADAAQQLFEGVEIFFELSMKLGEQAGSQQLTSGIVVALADGAGRGQCGFDVRITAAGGGAHLHQLIGDFGHRADDDHRFLR